MKINLTEKYKPFSHEAGTKVLLPKSSWRVTAYPAKLIFENLIVFEGMETLVILPHIEGPVDTFTVMQDLERGWVRIFGYGKKGYFSYRLVASSYKIILFIEKCPTEGIIFNFEGKNKNLNRKEALVISTSTAAFTLKYPEKIHFGSSKKQDWSLVKRRLNVQEILPIWFELGKQIPHYPIFPVGTSRYLKTCADVFAQRDRNQIGQAFLELFKMGFEGILSPRLVDTDYQSYVSDEKVPKEASSLFLLGEGARLIRKLFIDVQDKTLNILPCLPKEVHSGCFVNINCGENFTIDLRWSKKLIRSLILFSGKNRICTLGFQKPIKSFRMRKNRMRRGTVIPVGTSLELNKDSLYILDRFQK